MPAKPALAWTLAPLLLLLASSLACGGLVDQAPAAEDGGAVAGPETPADPAPGQRRRGGRRARGGGGADGGGGAEAPPSGPSPAYRTYEADGGKYRLVFTSEGVKKTWSNMSGSAVVGRWTHSGDAVVVKYTPVEHHGSVSETFLVRGECSLLRAVRVEKGGQAVEDPKTYVLDEPQCHR